MLTTIHCGLDLTSRNKQTVNTYTHTLTNMTNDQATMLVNNTQKVQTMNITRSISRQLWRHEVLKHRFTSYKNHHTFKQRPLYGIKAKTLNCSSSY